MASYIAQALVWWAKSTEGYIPPRHFRTLADDGLIEFDDFYGRYKLTPRGQAFLEANK